MPHAQIIARKKKTPESIPPSHPLRTCNDVFLLHPEDLPSSPIPGVLEPPFILLHRRDGSVMQFEEYKGQENEVVQRKKQEGP